MDSTFKQKNLVLQYCVPFLIIISVAGIGYKFVPKNQNLIVSAATSTKLWTVTVNPTTKDDSLNGLASDNDYIYTAGITQSSYWDSQLRFEKRKKTDGSLVWAQTENPSLHDSGYHYGYDYISSIAEKGDYIYVGGSTDLDVSHSAWFLEKRKKSNGSLVWTQKLDVHVSQFSQGGWINGIIADDNFLYVTGQYDGAYLEYDGKIRIEKRKLSDGSLVWVQKVNPTNKNDNSTGITQDDTYIYLIGSLKQSTQWSVEKRKKSDGSLVWNQTGAAPNGFYSTFSDITSDGTYIYTTGYSNTSGSVKWWTEARKKSDGTLVWTKQYNPSSGNAYPATMAVDDNHLYVGGYSNYPTSGSRRYDKWRMDKYNKIDGSLEWSEETDPTVNNDVVATITIDDSYIYLGGYVNSTQFTSIMNNSSNSEWRIEKWSKGDPTPAPTLTLTANPTSVIAGNNSTLTWNPTDATSCTASSSPNNNNWKGSKAASAGSHQQTLTSLTKTTTFTLKCTGAGGSQTKTAKVTVIPRPTVTLTANPISLDSGSSSKLTWNSSNTTACTASSTPSNPNWSGSKVLRNLSGISTGALTANGTFTLTCTGAGGTATKTVSVTVIPLTPKITGDIYSRASADLKNFIVQDGSIVAGKNLTKANCLTGVANCKKLSGYIIDFSKNNSLLQENIIGLEKRARKINASDLTSTSYWNLNSSSATGIQVPEDATANPHKNPEGGIWMVGAPGTPQALNISQATTFQNRGTIIVTGNLTISSNVIPSGSSAAGDQLGFIVLGKLIINDTNTTTSTQTIDAAFYADDNKINNATSDSITFSARTKLLNLEGFLVSRNNIKFPANLP